MKNALRIALLGIGCFATGTFAQTASLAPGSRTIMHAHNAFPYDGEYANRLDRVLATGLPVMVEQDLFWYTDKKTGQSKSITTHGAKYASPNDPTLETYFLAKARPVVEKALKEGNNGQWPLITLYLDFKGNVPEHFETIAALMEKYDGWITSSVKPEDPSVQSPLDLKPIMVLVLDNDDSKKRVFYDRVHVGGKIRIFGSVPKPPLDPALTKEQNGDRLVDVDPEKFLTEHANTYRRWWFIDWHFIEKGGQTKAGDWTTAKEDRLRKFVQQAHRMGYFLSTYTLNGYSEGNEALDKTYNFGSKDAGRERWKAAIRTGFDFVQTDEYEELAALLKQHENKPSVTANK